MGLNMNYRFFAEGFKTNYHIPEYNSYYKYSSFSIDRIAENAVSFNKKVNDARLKVTKLIESEDESSSYSTTIINGIKDEIDSVVKAVNDVYGNIMEFSDNTMNSLSEYKSSFDDNTLDHIRNKFDKESGLDFMARFNNLSDEIVRLHKEKVSPESEESQKIIGEYWGLIMEFTNGDMSMLPKLMEVGNIDMATNSWEERQKIVNDYVGPALEIYFKRIGINPFE